MSKKKAPSTQFNKASEKKFGAIWDIETDIFEDLEQCFEWQRKWTANAEKFTQQGNEVAVSNAKDLVSFWEERLLKTVRRMGTLQEAIDSSTKPNVIEFRDTKQTLIQPVRDALAKLSEAEAQDPKAILKALEPLMVEAEEPKSSAPGPLKGKPFRK